MQVTRVVVKAGRTIKTGDFENARFDVEVEAGVDAGDDLGLVMQGLWAMAAANLRAQTRPFQQRRQAEVEAIFLGFPPEVQEQLRQALGIEVVSGGDN